MPSRFRKQDAAVTAAAQRLSARDGAAADQVAFGPAAEEFKVLQDMAAALPKGKFLRGGLSSGFLSTAFTALSTSLTSLRTEAGGAPLTRRIVPMSREGRRAVGHDHWDIYLTRPGVLDAAGAAGAAGAAVSAEALGAGAAARARALAFLGKRRWDLAARAFAPEPLVAGAAGIAHAKFCFAQAAPRPAVRRRPR